jgi:hypothetical protein
MSDSERTPMSQCGKCHHLFAADQAPPTLCPRCGAEQTTDDASRQWVSIARLTNLAEVGYFADVLESEGFTTRVRQHNEFSALDGSWRTLFIVQVPPDQGTEAAEHLRQTLEQTADETPRPDAKGFFPGSLSAGEEGSPASTSLWKPVVVVLIASGLFYGARHFDRQVPEKPRPGPSLWDVLTESDQVFTSNEAFGRANYRLVTDRRSRTVWLQEDTDGDGQMDRIRCFRAGEMVRELAR